MKQFIFLLLLSVLTFSCNDDDGFTDVRGTERVRIQAGETYRFIIGQYTDNTVIEILQPPTNHSQSEVSYDEQTGLVNYYYTPEDEFIGSDEFILFYEGIIESPAQHFITFKITVTE